MKRFLVFAPSFEEDWREVKDRLRREGLRVVDVRVGKSIEIDLLTEDLNEDLPRVRSVVGEISMVKEAERVEEDLWTLLNQQRFWECHEVLERKWRGLEGQRKDLVRALILLCASLIKYRKGEVGISDQLLKWCLSLIPNLPEEVPPFDYVRLIFDS
jgi:hypothetical protein